MPTRAPLFATAMSARSFIHSFDFCVKGKRKSGSRGRERLVFSGQVKMVMWSNANNGRFKFHVTIVNQDVFINFSGARFNHYRYIPSHQLLSNKIFKKVTSTEAESTTQQVRSR